MFDNLRDDSSFYEDEQNEPNQEPEAQAQPAVSTRRSSPGRRSTRFLGMTAQQRFLISIMLLITVCVMGTLAMVATGRMAF